MTETLTGAQALIRALEHEGVDTIFGVPGGAILPAYDPILDSPIRHILARHEQGAGHMASGYAWATRDGSGCASPPRVREPPIWSPPWRTPSSTRSRWWR